MLNSLCCYMMATIFYSSFFSNSLFLFELIVSAFQLSRRSCIAEYCKDGELKDDAGKCVPCPRGYYKNNTEYEFGPCNLCPTEFITAVEGAPSKDNCTVRKLTLWKYSFSLNTNIERERVSTDCVSICLKTQFTDIFLTR